MNRKLIPVGATAAVAAAALAPAAAGAADPTLGGAPQLRLIDSHHATLTFAADRLPRKPSGAIDARIRFNGGQRVSSLKPTGRHGQDVVYSAKVTSKRALRVGVKYTVAIKLADETSVVRKLKLHDKRS